MWLIILSDQLTIVALVGLYPTNKLIVRRLLPRRLAPLVHRHHAVLAAVSHGYPPPKDRYLRVTHPSATEGCPSVRLACVKHAASVRSEPGSNSQVHPNQPKPNPTKETRPSQPKQTNPKPTRDQTCKTRDADQSRKTSIKRIHQRIHPTNIPRRPEIKPKPQTKPSCQSNIAKTMLNQQNAKKRRQRIPSIHMLLSNNWVRTRSCPLPRGRLKS